MICSRRCAVWWRRNWQWFLPGSIAWGLLFVVCAMSLWLLALTFWPSGPPVNIQRFVFEAPRAFSGQRIPVRIEVQKDWHCPASPNIVFIDPDGRETQFQFPDWPLLKTGGSDLAIWTRVPPLELGMYTYQARLSYSCPGGDFTATSSPEQIEIIARPAVPAVP